MDITIMKPCFESNIDIIFLCEKIENNIIKIYQKTSDQIMSVLQLQQVEVKEEAGTKWLLVNQCKVEEVEPWLNAIKNKLDEFGLLLAN